MQKKLKPNNKMKATDQQVQDNNYIIMSNWLKAYLLANKLPSNAAKVRYGETPKTFIIDCDLDLMSDSEIEKLLEAWKEEMTKPSE